MKKIVLVGYLNPNQPQGPSNVLANLLSNLKKKEVNCEFINIYSSTPIGKIIILFRILSIIFMRNCVINVHSFGYKIPNIIYLISRVNKKNRYFLTLHGLMSEESKYITGNGYYSEYFKNVIKYNRLEKKLVQKFPNLIVVSKALKEKIFEEYGRIDRVFVIYNGVEKARLRKRNRLVGKRVKAIMTGGVFGIKSVFELLEIIKHLNESFDVKIHLDIYGRYESEASLNKFYKLIENYHLREYVSYKGMLNRESLEQKYLDSDVCFCISKFDTFNLTALESMIVGTPVIISKQCGASELITHKYDGFKVDMYSNYKEEIMDIFRLIIENPDLYYQVSENAIKTANKMSWEHVTENYIRTFFSESQR